MIPHTHEGLTHYLTEVGKIPLLDPEHEAWADEETLVVSNLRLVVTLAKSYARDPEELLDRIQDGNYGLILAARTFDPSKGKFSSWATGYIKGSIRNRFTDGLGKPLRHRTEGPEVSSLEVLEGFDPPANDDPVEATHQALALAAVSRVLTQKQRQVIEGRLQGETHEALAQLMGSSYQNVQQLEKNALKKIQAL